MFKKLFFIFGTLNKKHLDAGHVPDIEIKKIIKAQEFVKFPKDVSQLDESYKQLVRELSKR